MEGDAMLHGGHLIVTRGIAALLLVLLALVPVDSASRSSASQELALQEYAVQPGSHAHDAVPDANGYVWYTGQANGTMGRLDPATGDYIVIPIGERSAPHGVIIGPDLGVWVTDGGLNAIVRVDPASLDVQVFPLPADKPNA